MTDVLSVSRASSNGDRRPKRAGDESIEDAGEEHGHGIQSSTGLTSGESPNQFHTRLSSSYPYPYPWSNHRINNDRKAPSSLFSLCVDTVCRSLPWLDGDLPPGLPDVVVDAIVARLSDHADLNAVTLRALRRCGVGPRLDLAACRGVTDDWFAFDVSSSSELRALDLSDSPGLTDHGLLRLRPSSHLESVRLDDCHALEGAGLAVLLSRSRHCLRDLSLAQCRRLTDEGVIHAASCRDSLRTLNLEGCRCLTELSLRAISDATRLRRLDLTQCDAAATNESLSWLEPLEELEELSLGWCRRIDDLGLRTLCGQPGRERNLRALRLARLVGITAKGAAECLARLDALEELDVSGCWRLAERENGDYGDGALERTLAQLKTLDVSYCPRILRSPCWSREAVSLHSLRLDHSGVRDDDLARFARLPNLEELSLDSCPLGDLGVYRTSEVAPNLRSLNLADTHLTDAGMTILPRFTKLTELSLFHNDLTDTGLRPLAEMEGLESLNLDSRDVGDEGLKHLRSLKRLRRLDLFSNPITNVGCSHISEITSLESLELCGGEVGDPGCVELAKLVNLTDLNLSQNERITNAGATALTSSLSRLRVLNLSHTRVDSGALRCLGKLSELRSLALYGCGGVNDDDDGGDLDRLRQGSPRLKCLKVDRRDRRRRKRRRKGEGAIDNVDGDENLDFDNDDDDDESDYRSDMDERYFQLRRRIEQSDSEESDES